MNLERLAGFNCELFTFRFGNSYRMKVYNDFVEAFDYILKEDPKAYFVMYNHEDFSETSMDIPKDEDIYRGGSFITFTTNSFEFDFGLNSNGECLATVESLDEIVHSMAYTNKLTKTDKDIRATAYANKFNKTDKDIRAWYIKTKDKSYFIINQAEYNIEVKEFTKIKTLKDLKDAMWRYNFSFPVWYSCSANLLYGIGFKSIRLDTPITLDDCSYCSEVPRILLKDTCTFDNTNFHQKNFSVTTDVRKKSISSADIVKYINDIKDPEEYKDNTVFDLDGAHNRYYFLCCYAGGVYTGFILSREYVPYPY